MPKLKKKSANQKIIALRLKRRTKREDENFKNREKQRYLERRARQKKEDNSKNESGEITEGRTTRYSERSSTPRLKKKKVIAEEGNCKKKLCAGLKKKERKRRKSPVRYTFDELLEYIRLSKVSKPVKEGAPEEIVVPVDVFFGEGVTVKEEPDSETQEDEDEEVLIDKKVSLIPVLEANGVPNSSQERCEPTGQLSLGKKLKLQMEAKLVALNAKGGLGSCPRGRYECYYCDERLVTRNTLNLHIRAHSIGKPIYECSVCKKKLSSPRTLVHHERLHTGDYPLKCSLCNKGFSAHNDLTAHMRRHTGSLQCELCNRNFRLQSTLKSHMLMHSSEK